MTCPLCSSNKADLIKPYRYKTSFFKNTSIYECRDCTLNFINPFPVEKEWERYNEDYFENAHGGVDIVNSNDDYNIGIAKVRYRALTDFLSSYDIQVKSVLEVGPGPGFIMREWFKHHPETIYHVIESDKSVHKTLKQNGATILKPNSSKQLKNYDLLIVSHVLEHTLEPVEFMKNHSANVRKGGGIFVETPCLDHKYKYSPEPHVIFFNKATHKFCFSEAGLTAIHQTYNGDILSRLKFLSIIKKTVAKIHRFSGIPFLKMFPVSYPNKARYNLHNNEAVSIVETAPHVEQTIPARWVRSFGIKQ